MHFEGITLPGIASPAALSLSAGYHPGTYNACPVPSACRRSGSQAPVSHQLLTTGVSMLALSGRVCPTGHSNDSVFFSTEIPRRIEVRALRL